MLRVASSDGNGVGVARGRFGLPDDRFLFLMMYDVNSVQERKNPRGAIEAFKRADEVLAALDNV